MKKSLYFIIFIFGLFVLNCQAELEKAKFGIPEEEMNLIIAGLLINTGYSDTGNGTILDNSLNLEWKKCSQGQSFRQTQNDCQGTTNGSDYTPNDEYLYGATAYNYCNVLGNTCNSLSIPQTLLASTTENVSSGAYNSCDTEVFDGKSDWRVPTGAELKKLTAGGKTSMISYFPNTATSYYWTSWGDELDTTGYTAKAISFREDTFGNDESIVKTTKLYVICVRNR
ncbi:MAG: DUF1566 domain-containing protein [Leptospiraceae bacterium]|nr:DUF1566 domain-containing protein [Leptospiraceae bacterium]MCP5496428.1 DUF1566 domain-containing protein [Leptospiraceae bacterium]